MLSLASEFLFVNINLDSPGVLVKQNITMLTQKMNHGNVLNHNSLEKCVRARCTCARAQACAHTCMCARTRAHMPSLNEAALKHCSSFNLDPNEFARFRYMRPKRPTVFGNAACQYYVKLRSSFACKFLAKLSRRPGTKARRRHGKRHGNVTANHRESSTSHRNPQQDTGN